MLLAGRVSLVFVVYDVFRQERKQAYLTLVLLIATILSLMIRRFEEKHNCGRGEVEEALLYCHVYYSRFSAAASFWRGAACR